jgi:hypothetical protein
MSASLQIQYCEILTIHGKEQAALRRHGLWELVRVVGDLFQREATETWRQVRVLLVIWDPNSALEGDLEIFVDYKGAAAAHKPAAHPGVFLGLLHG